MAHSKLLLISFISIFCVSAVISAENAYLQQELDAQLPNHSGAVLVVDIHSMEVLGSVQPELFQHDFPPGSLIKPFTVISYYKTHTAFPIYQCPPTSENDPDGCWDRKGHGKVDITRAIAFSCNVYFRQLAQQVLLDSFQSTLRDFGLPDVSRLPETVQRKAMVGMTNEWTVSPAVLLHAYCSIYTRNELPRPLLSILKSGMMESAQEGTSLEARKITGVPLLGKTGTTLQWINGQANWKETQGWWIGLYPVDHPEIAVLAFAPKGRGATEAAPIGGKALAAYLRLAHRRDAK